jgi:inosose dehydratase
MPAQPAYQFQWQRPLKSITLTRQEKLSMSKIMIGNAPVSWGVLGMGAGSHQDYRQVMDEMARAGYEVTELGPYGYYPTDPHILRTELERRKLKLASSYVPLPLESTEQAMEVLDTVDRVCSLLSQFGVREIIIADDFDPERARIAGSVSADGTDGWSEQAWQQVAITLELVARTCRDRFGMRVAFHPHVGTYVETPAEVERLMALTDPELVGLCFDTGHYVYGGGDVLEAARTYANRIWYVHLKDIWPEKLQQVRQERLPARQAWEMGLFAELGQGSVEFSEFVEILQANDYQGWMVVEQDIVTSADTESPWSPLESAIRSRAYLRDTLGL